jgi:carbamoyltransferase
MQVFQIREEKRAAVPVVTHVDGSGRLQTVAARK